MEEFFKKIPPVTRVLFCSTIFLSLAVRFNFLPARALDLSWEPLVYQFQIWRLITNFFIHALNMQFLINLMFLYKYSGFLEETTFDGRTADYVWFMMFGCSLLACVGLWLRWGYLGLSMIIMILYYWSRKNPNLEMSFWFGITFKAIYFPWILCMFNVLMGGTPIMQLLGIAIGHVYFFLEDVYPRTSGIRILRTPQFLYNLIPAEYNQNTAHVHQQRMAP